MRTITKEGGGVDIKISGSPGAIFDLRIKNEDGLEYNFESKKFTSSTYIFRNQIIDSTGKYKINFIAPSVTDDDFYDVFVLPLGRTSKGNKLPKEEAALRITQYGTTPTILFDNSSGAGVFTLASALTTGVTISGPADTLGNKPWTNSGTIVKSTDIIYASSPKVSWDTETSGDFTNLKVLEKTTSKPTVGTTIRLNNTTNLATGMYVEGEGIRGDVKISSISSPDIVVDTSLRLGDKTKLKFTNGKFEHSNITGRITGSGTNSLTLNLSGTVTRVGVANITSMLDIEDVVSRNPNAFPMRAKCKVGTMLELNLKSNQIDADSGDWTYKCHSVPGSGEGSVSVSAGATLVDGLIGYTAPSALSDIGQTCTFVYKTTNANERDSSTTTGIVYVEITNDIPASALSTIHESVLQ